jgi:hypothetical protein
MKGYKASYNQRCHTRKFEVGRTYTLKHKPIICAYGFHFCKTPDNTLRYYDFIKFSYNYQTGTTEYRIDKEFVLFEVTSKGSLDKDFWCGKYCTNKIKIERIVPLQEYGKVFVDCEFAYDSKGRLIFFKDQKGHIYKFDRFGKCIERHAYGKVYKWDKVMKSLKVVISH